MTGIDVVIDIYRLLNVPAVTALSRVWQHNRPRNSSQTDIVISIPEYNAGQFNTGYVDINVFTPNKPVLDNDTTFPDMAKFKQVVDTILPLLTATANFDLDVRIVGIPIRDKDGNWYVNIRVGFQGISNSAKPILLYSLSSLPDGYGGSTATKTLEYSGRGVQQDIAKGSQLNINIGRYEFNLRCDWIVDFRPSKNWQLHSTDGVFVINGIVPEGDFWRLSTVGRDMNDVELADFNTIINSMPAIEDKPFIVQSYED